MEQDIIKQLTESSRNIPADDLREPNYDVKPNEEVIGIVSLYARQLYHNSKKMVTNIMYVDGDEEASCKIYYTSKLLMDMFWMQARSEFNQWGNEIGIRKGWQLVIVGESTPPSGIRVVKLDTETDITELHNLFKGLFGS